MRIHGHNGSGLPPESKDERQQLRAFGEQLCSGPQSLKRLTRACEIARKHRIVTRREARRAKYEHLGTIYQLLCAAYARPDFMTGMLEHAAQRGFTVSATTSTALLFVKVLSCRSLEPATASQQALALRGAALKGIAPEEFAKRAPLMGGITKLAAHFRAERSSSARKGGKVARKAPYTPFPQLKWSRKAIERWEQLFPKGKDVRIVVRRTSPHEATVVSVTRHHSEAEVRHEL